MAIRTTFAKTRPSGPWLAGSSKSTREVGLADKSVTFRLFRLTVETTGFSFEPGESWRGQVETKRAGGKLARGQQRKSRHDVEIASP